LIIVAISGCQGTGQIDPTSLSAQERAAISSLSWLRDADASRDAKQAIARGDKRLLAMASRSPSLPGVPAEQTSKAKAVCGIHYVKGSTDAVMGETHLRLLQAARDYARQYNGIMLSVCLNQAK